MPTPAKIPIRGITKMLTNLDPGIRAKLENAFSEAEEQLDVHNTSTIDKVTKRTHKGTVNSPILSVTTNTLGFDLNWPKLKDRFITLYEVQIATTSNFSNAVSYNTVDNFFQVEGAATITYARVRGVKWNGECGHWSNIQTINVAAGATGAGPLVYTKTIADVDGFYRNFPGLAYPSPIQTMTIMPARSNGGVMFFGSMGVEFYVDSTGFRGKRGDHFYVGTAVAVDDSIMVTINGQRVQKLNYIPCFEGPGWSNLQSPPQSTVFGYSVGFGPGFLPHSQFYQEQFGFVFPNTASEINDKVASVGTHTGWLTKKNILKEYDPSLQEILSTHYSTITGFGGAGASEITKTLVTQNFKFAIPSTNKILGIQLDIIASNTYAFQPMTNTYNRIRLLDSTGLPRPTIKASGDDFITATYGGPDDLWGEAPGFWTADKINSQYFGVDVQGKGVYQFTGFADGSIFDVYGMQLTVYTDMNGPELATIRVQYKPRTNDFYSYPYTRSILKNCTLNALEFGVVST